MEISRGRLESSTQYNIKDAFAGLKQKIEPAFVHAKEWASKKLQDLGLTAQAWVHSLNENPLFQEFKQAVIETAKEPAVQNYAAEKLGQLASHSPDITNTALNISSTLDDVQTSLNHPVAHTVMEKMDKKPEGKKLHKSAKRINEIVNIFTESVRTNRLATEPV